MASINTSKGSLPSYSDAERQRRWDLAREFMSRKGLDALLVYGEHEDAGPAAYTIDTWFTNDRPGTTVVFLHTGSPIEIVPLPLFIMDHNESRNRGEAVWVPPENIRLGRDADTLVGVLKELDLTQATIGVLGLDAIPPWHAHGIVPFNMWQRVLLQCPDITFEPVGTGFLSLLQTLSDEEIAVVRHSASIGEKMAKAMVHAIRVGVTDTEIFAAGQSTAGICGTVVPWIHLNVGPTAVLWGPPRTAWRPQPPRLLQAGDVVASEIFCFFGMRQTQHQLTVALGEVHPNVERAAAVARTCYEAGLKAMRTGALFGDVAEAMLKPVLNTGGWVKGPQVHSLNPLAAICAIPADSAQYEGLEPYPKVPGMGTWPKDLLLQRGMTFALEPSCGFGKHAVTVGGTIIVGDEGAIELNPFTSNLVRVN